MALTAQQIVSLSTQIAKVPGMVIQAGQFLNAILNDLCRNYDLDVAQGVNVFSFNSVAGNGSGPYALPANYLRTRVIDGKDDIFYTIDGVPYPMIQYTRAEYDWMVQTAGFQSYPVMYTTDLSVAPPNLYVWPPASGSYPVSQRYQKLMPDIVTPETSNDVPWFPVTQYLINELAGRLMQLSDDSRADGFLSDNDEQHPTGSGVILRKYLKNVSDREGAVKTVGLDRRRFGRKYDTLKNTKNVGW